MIMTKERIKQDYCWGDIGYDYAIELLIELGFNKYSADQYLFAE